jgi:hypothetical protein
MELVLKNTFLECRLRPELDGARTRAKSEPSSRVADGYVTAETLPEEPSQPMQKMTEPITQWGGYKQSEPVSLQHVDLPIQKPSLCGFRHVQHQVERKESQRKKDGSKQLISRIPESWPLSGTSPPTKKVDRIHKMLSDCMGEWWQNDNEPMCPRSRNTQKKVDQIQIMYNDPAGKWWQKDKEPVCPISNFPIHMLPYPPYKLNFGRPWDANGYVDGQHLVCHVITSRKWEVLGRALTDSDITRIDAYMSKCKLGSLRLGLALKAELENDVIEMSKIRTKAQHMLAASWQKKRARLKKMSGHP